MNLRELTNDQKGILKQVEGGDFNLDDVSDHLELLESERNKKIENYLHVINDLEAKYKAATNEAERVCNIALSRKKALDNIKEWLLMSMKDGEKRDFDLFRVSKVKGREKVKIINETLIDDCYTSHRTVMSIDKRMVLEDLKKGYKLDGAEIEVGNSSLRIK